MALNKAIIMGRITNDLEIRQTQSGLAVLSFTVAVDGGKDKPADFIDCVAWRQQAEFIGRYFGKGRMIAVEGKIKTRTYEDKSGNKRKVVELLVDSASFTGEPKSENNGGFSGSGSSEGNLTVEAVKTSQSANLGTLDGFEDVLSDEGVPF